MNFGEALVIAGLIAQKRNTTTQKLPFFGELPYIGAAFSRKATQDSESELIIMVTPEYVSPAPASQFPQQGPGMFTDAPTDKELFGMGLLEVPKFGDACENGCQNCLPGGDCQNCRHGLRMNACPDCQQGGGSCVPDGYGISNDGQTPARDPAAIKPASSTKPVSSSRIINDRAGSNKSTTTAKPKTTAGSSRSGSSGLISPTMR
jgi:pilus assembly protein CpaC